MSTALFFLCAAVFLTMGHVFKTFRWRRFTCIYESVPMPTLLGALASGYLLNFFLPLHLGDVLRIVISGRKMKNGYAYALATVLVDRCLDVVCVGLLFFALSWGEPTLWKTLVLYGALLGGACLVLFVMLRTSRACKKAALRLCSVFNDGIKFRLLFFLWSLITSFKDLRKKLHPGKLFLDTVMMWASYLLSYYFIAGLLSALGETATFTSIFYTMFRSDALLHSTFTTTHALFSLGSELALCAVILLPLPLLLGACLVFRRKREEVSTLSLLPQLEPQEKMQFLNVYFEGENREAMQEFLSMNQDVSIVKDCSAGSEATTMLCLSRQGAIYRKYAFGTVSAGKLKAQVQWLHRQEGKLPLPQIFLEREGAYSYCYDMRYDSGAIGFFEYIYSRPPEKSWQLLCRVLEDLERQLYAKAGRPVTAEEIHSYVTEKVTKNLEAIAQSKLLGPLAAARTLHINGAAYQGLPVLLGLLEEANLAKVFAGDLSSEVHGDLTVENIVCYGERDAYYLIDPNPGNPVSTPGIDYGKLLQSLHGHYELLGYAHGGLAEGDTIEFFLPDSQHYHELYLRFDRWLEERFTAAQRRSIYYHELIHWLRLISYKLRKNEKNAVKYFAAFILVMNDVQRRFGRTEDEAEAGDL